MYNYFRNNQLPGYESRDTIIAGWKRLVIVLLSWAAHFWRQLCYNGSDLSFLRTNHQQHFPEASSIFACFCLWKHCLLDAYVAGLAPTIIVRMELEIELEKSLLGSNSLCMYLLPKTLIAGEVGFCPSTLVN